MGIIKEHVPKRRETPRKRTSLIIRRYLEEHTPAGSVKRKDTTPEHVPLGLQMM